MLPKKAKSKSLLKDAANWVGLALIVYILLSSVVPFLGNLALRWAFAGVAKNNISAAPEWGVGIYRILSTIFILLPPFLLLTKVPKKLKPRLPFGKSKIKIIVLLPLFLGIGLLINAISTKIFGTNTVTTDTGGLNFPQTFIGILLYFIYACILPAILEEILFRGMLQGIFKRWGAWFSITLSSILFAFMHNKISIMFVIFLLSMLLGYVREISGTLWACIILHFFNNVVAFLNALAQNRMTGVGAIGFIFWLTITILILFVAACWYIWHSRLLSKFKIPFNKIGKGLLLRKCKALFTAPVFVLGCLSIVAFFVLTMV